MKKSKLSLGPGGIKGWLTQHVEKLVFGLVIVVVLVFVFLGYRIKSDLADKTPDKLDKLAATAVSNIERPSMDELKKERVPRSGQGGQYAARVDSDDPPDPEVFAIKPWDQPLGSPGSKREDPTIFAPIRLETTALTGALCVRAEEGDVDPMEGLENAPAAEKKEKQPKQRSRKGGSGYPGMPGSMPGAMPSSMPGMSSMPGGEMAGPYGLGMEADKDKKKKKDETPVRRAERTYPENKVCGYRPAGGAGMAGRGAMGGMYGGMPPGMPSSMMPGLPGGITSGRTGAADSEKTVPGQPIARSAHLVVVKALVPFRKQADEYKRVLGEAIGYDPGRDQPRIIFFQAQRVDVTDDPTRDVQESDWQLVMTPKTAQTKMIEQRWHGIMPEVADLAYVDPNATLPCPPMMLRCMDEAMLHSEVPRGKTSTTLEMTPGDEGKKEEAGKKEGAPSSDLPGGLPAAGGVGGMPGVGGGYPGMPGGYSIMPSMPGSSGATYPGMPGSSGPAYPGMPGSSGPAYPGMPGSSGAGYPGMPSGGVMPMMPGSGGSMMSSGPMMAGGYRGSYGSLPQAVQYKLIRFADLDVQPGRVYRYRVRVFLEDPNNPNTDPTNGYVNIPPRRRSLSMGVIERLNKLQGNESSKGVYYVTSDWSEPTDLVTLPSTARLFAGEVEPARTAAGAEGTLVQQSEPYANVVPAEWYETRAVDVAVEMRAFRGSVLNLSKRSFEVLDPVTLVIKLLRNADLKTNHLVVDIRGGEDLPGDRKSLVTSAGEVALIDDRGNFIVRNELDDYLDFARFSLADEVTTSGGMGGYPGMNIGGGETGGPPGMMMPSVPGMGPPGGTGGKRGARGGGSTPPGMMTPPQGGGGRRGR